MAKVLISFLGTGRQNRKNDLSLPLSQRKYDSTKYLIDGRTYETPFVAAALSEHYNVDKVFMIGTVHSMWEEVYNCYSHMNNQKIDEDVYLELGSYCETANSSSDLDIPYKDVVEKALGGKSKVILIKYGLSQEEIEENIKIILKINDLLNTGDELIVDVSHSFRSLPLMIMNLLIYIKGVSRKSITLKHIHYGMLEVVGELGYAPIVDLESLIDVNDWISGASAFAEYGNAYRLAELLQSKEPALAARLRRFSDVLNLNHLNGTYRLVKESEGLAEIHSPFAKLIVEPILNAFVRNFKNCKNEAQFQFCLAKWQYEHKNYLSSYVSLAESYVTLVCDKYGYDWTLYKLRDKGKERLMNEPSLAELHKLYDAVRSERNNLAHCLEADKSYKDMISLLKERIKQSEPWFNQKI